MIRIKKRMFVENIKNWLRKSRNSASSLLNFSNYSSIWNTMISNCFLIWRRRSILDFDWSEQINQSFASFRRFDHFSFILTMKYESWRSRRIKNHLQKLNLSRNQSESLLIKLNQQRWLIHQNREAQFELASKILASRKTIY